MWYLDDIINSSTGEEGNTVEESPRKVLPRLPRNGHALVTSTRQFHWTEFFFRSQAFSLFIHKTRFYTCLHKQLSHLQDTSRGAGIHLSEYGLSLTAVSSISAGHRLVNAPHIVATNEATVLDGSELSCDFHRMQRDKSVYIDENVKMMNVKMMGEISVIAKFFCY